MVFSLLNSVKSPCRRLLSTGDNMFKKPYAACEEQSGLILGVHVPNNDVHGQTIVLTKTGERFDRMIGHSLFKHLEVSQPTPRLGEGKVFYGLDSKYSAIAAVGLGDECLGYNLIEQVDERKEAIRTAVGVGIRLLKDVNVSRLFVESCGHAESAAEGASMAAWLYQDLKAPNKRKQIKKMELFDSSDLEGWKIGLHKAAAQNFTRLLTETPANNLTPSTFAQTTIEMLSKYGVSVNVRTQNWTHIRNFHGFLAASKGSCEPPVLLEILYEGCNPNICPIVLIGKGVMFDSGGLCLKPYEKMKHARGEMSGAAAVVATIRAIASLQLPMNVVGLLPLSVNSPGATAYKPGDIIKTYNGKTILVQDTDAEALLHYADVLAYSKEYSPKFILDIGTMASALVPALSNSAAGVWCNNDSLYEVLRSASIHTGDRIFRFPLWNYFTQYMATVEQADYWNKAPYLVGGEPCKVAAFLREFVPKNTDWIHIDTFNTNYTDGQDFTYLGEGMSGRYTRMIVEFLAQLSCRTDEMKQGVRC